MELTDQQREDLELLKNWQHDLLNGIVNQLPDYKKATWSE